MKTDEVKRRYAAAEEKTDSFLDRLGASPWTLAAIVAVLVAAVVLGAVVF